MRLRQVALVAKDLSPVAEDFRRIFAPGEAFADPGVASFGLVNRVFPVGDTFLELLSPDRPGTTAGRLLERRGGDGGYMVIVQSQDRDGDRKRMEALGVRIVWSVQTEDAGTIHLHPRDVGGAIVSLDWMDPPESWKWAGPGWRERARVERVTGIEGVDLQAADPRAMARRWGEVLAHPVGECEGRDAGTHPAIDLSGGGRIRFLPATDGRGDGVCGLTLGVSDAAAIRREAGDSLRADGAISLCGTLIHLSEAGLRAKSMI